MVMWTKSDNVIVEKVLETSLPRLTTTRLDLNFHSVSKVLCVVDVVEAHTSSHDLLHFVCPCLGLIIIHAFPLFSDCR